MKEVERRERFLKAVEMEAYVASKDPLIPVLLLILDNGEELELYNVPYEIARFVMNDFTFVEKDSNKERNDIFSFIATHEDIVNLLKDDIEKVVIDDFDEKNMVYSATIYFSRGGTKIQRKFIPSHAIFLAIIANKEIFVSEKVLRRKVN